MPSSSCYAAGSAATFLDSSRDTEFASAAAFVLDAYFLLVVLAEASAASDAFLAAAAESEVFLGAAYATSEAFLDPSAAAVSAACG